MQLSALHSAQTALSISFHELGKHRVCQHWHVAENIMENIWLLKVFKFLFRSDERTSRKAAIGEMIKEDLIRHQLGYGHDAPASFLFQLVAQLLHIRDAALRQAKRLNRV